MLVITAFMARRELVEGEGRGNMDDDARQEMHPSSRTRRGTHAATHGAVRDGCLQKEIRSRYELNAATQPPLCDGINAPPGEIDIDGAK
jgi:hypothetical protein